METAAMPRDFHELRLFLEKHCYVPQGKYVRVGSMSEQDMEHLLRGKLLPVWRWAFATIKNESDAKLIQRNIGVARKQIQSYREQREAARSEHLRLDAQRKYLKDSLEKENRKQQELLQKLTSLEQEKTRKLRKAQEKKEQEILCQANQNCRLKCLENIRDRLNDCGILLNKEHPTNSQAFGHGTNTVLSRTLNVSEAASGNSSAENATSNLTKVEELRHEDYRTLVDDLMKLATTENIFDKKVCLSEDNDAAQHRVKDIITISTSEKTIEQVQALLRDFRKEHIASFLQTEEIYSQANMVYEKISAQNEATGSDPFKSSPRFCSRDDGVEVSSQSSNDALERLSQLELQRSVLAAVIERGRELYDQIMSQTEAMRRRKSDLDHRITKVRTYQQREQEIVCKLHLSHVENRRILHSIQQTQRQLHEFVCRDIMTFCDKAAVHDRLFRYRTLLLKESRYFSSVQLSGQQVAVLRRHSNTKVVLPRQALYINQIQDESETVMKQSRVTLRDVFRSLGVPSFGNWMHLFHCLGKSTLNSSLVPQLHRMLSKLEEEFVLDKTSGQQDGSLHARHFLAELSSTCRQLEDMNKPLLENSYRVATEVVQDGIPALQRAITTWTTEPAWNVNINPQDKSTMRA
uniref:AlNc14C113G6449 protein n=1 Tax=Albugo laibachii Nc14 TaxID=890382 RepID=F0WIR4_9STRA|nr:AlNc14C113G6449 [Albugo laibachii Nc14]|eukprot:CCA21158.1 AlNc14C113G6449 [Albugo laibachii Nc14]